MQTVEWIAPQLSRFLKGTAFVAGFRVSGANGDQIVSPVRFPARQAERVLGYRDTGHRGLELSYVSRQESLLHPFKPLNQVSLLRVRHPRQYAGVLFPAQQPRVSAMDL